MKRQPIPSSIEFSCVAQTLRRASRLVSRRYEDLLRPFDLTASQYTILNALSDSQGLPQGRIAQVLGFEQTTFTRLVKTLEKRGLISIQPDPDDRRGRLLQKTPAGQALYEKAFSQWELAQQASFERLTDNDWQTLKTILSKLSG